MSQPSSASPKCTLLAPVSGVIVPITDVPDPTFAEKMLGDGIAIDPTGETLRAPCPGTITQLHKAHHALTLATPDGMEILMHIGLETVLLKGRGFTPLVKEGDTVKTGDELIGFDAAYLVHNAASLLVLTLVTSGGRVFSTPTPSGTAEAGETPILVLSPDGGQDDAGAAAPGGGETKTSPPILIRNPAGIHARPAAVLVNSAKQFAASVRLVKNGKEANAKSVVAVMGLEVDHDDTITIAAAGPDADAAIAKLEPLVRSGLGEDLSGSPAKTIVAPPKAPPRPVSSDPNRLLGVSASPGVVTGHVFQLRHAEVKVEEKGRGVEEEKARLLAGLGEAKKELIALQDGLKKSADAGKAAIFSAHQELLEDPEILDAVQQGIRKGESAAFAWKRAYTAQAETLAKLSNELLAGRANDIRDVGRRVLIRLAGTDHAAPEVPPNVILIAEDMTPSDTAGLDKNKVLGFATTGGSATSHVAILARSASIPAVAAVVERALEIPDNTVVVLDGGKGEIRLNPTEEEIAKVRAIQEEAAKRREEELREAANPAVTRDGHRIKVVANIGSVAEAREALPLGGEGVGLLRSEFLFLQRVEPPAVEEQAAVYVTIAKTLGRDRDLVVRTLDVGGDKPLVYLPLPEEDNPFLGVRGIRLNLVDKALLTDQVRAILSAAPHTKLHIMFPMVSMVEELREAKAIVIEEMKKAGIESGVGIGIMVEVPSAAVMADSLAREADFFSIGTNDLTQYTLAMDRGNPRLAHLTDALHPAVLALIAETVKGAHNHGKWVGVCGGLASELPAVPVLLGLGVDELSVTVSAIPAIKAAVRRQTMAKCRALAGEVLAMPTAAEVRARLDAYQAEG